MHPVARNVPYSLSDGLGVRLHTEAGLEVLTVESILADHPATDATLRSAVDRCAAAGRIPLAKVHEVARDWQHLKIVSDAPSGVRLSELLEGLASGRERIEDAVAVAIAGAVIEAVAALHAADGSLAHGALTPAHVVFSEDDGCLLTDGIFARSLEALHLNREHMWRRFGVALPPSASTHRFDQRCDVTQLGAIVLAIMLRRPLTAEEYPRGIADLVIAATPDSRGPHASAVRMWLQQALQLHPRAVFGSAVGASQAFTEIIAFSGVRRTARRVSTPFPWMVRPVTMAAPRWGHAR
jgi:hypothetical protein